MEGRSLLLLLALVALSLAGCTKDCVRPTGWYNFTRFPDLQKVIDDVTFYFPTSAHPPQVMIDDSRALPTITFTKQSKLKVTFLYEGAGNRNSLGFFLFRKNAAGNNEKYYEEILIPDVSFDRNCLWGGLSVDSARTMQPGEMLGFFLKGDGFCLDNPPTFYSLPEFNSANSDKLRHIGTYLDRYRELLIFGFEDLVGLGDKDYEDTMFFFDTYGLSIDFGNIARGCTNPPCRNGGTCNWDDGRCNCPKPQIWGGYSCHVCKCEDYMDPCISKACSAKECVPSVWTDATSSCLSTQNARCINTTVSCNTQSTSDDTNYEMSSMADSSSTVSSVPRSTGRAESSTRATSQQPSSDSKSDSTTDSTTDSRSSDSSSPNGSSDDKETRGTGSNGSQSNQGTNSGSQSGNGTSNQGTQSSVDTNSPDLIAESSAYMMLPLVIIPVLGLVM